jgi:hypothetical protein
MFFFQDDLIYWRAQCADSSADEALELASNKKQ